MLRDSFTNRWMIGGFCFLIVFATACYFWYQHELAPYEQQAAETEEILRQSERAQKADTENKEKQAVSDALVVLNTSTTEAAPLKLEDITIEWPEGADWPVNWKVLLALPDEEFAKLPDATIQALNRAYFAEHKLAVPPSGYHYNKDKTGKWRLVRNNEPQFTLKWVGNTYGNLHQLSDAEYERYKALRHIADNAEDAERSRAAGILHPSEILAYPQTVCDLAQQWYDELHEKTRGPVPVVSSTTLYDREKTQADRDRVNRLAHEFRNAVIGAPRSTVFDKNLVETILDEIEVELGITIERESLAAKRARQEWKALGIDLNN